MTRVVTTIGSLPYLEPEKAVRLTLEYLGACPAWPQLPKRTFKENMYVQFSENFPGITIDEENKKIFFCDEKFDKEIENFYSNYLNKNFEYFKISQEFASGIYHFDIDPKNVKFLKGQITGPVTFGLVIKNKNGKSIIYNDTLKEIILKHISMKAIWQIKKLKEKFNKIIIFLDEPYLSAYGSAFTPLSQNEVISCINEVIDEIRKEEEVLIGIHCCANTDWSMLLNTKIDILSFDAYGFFDSLLLYREALKDFIERNGILAFGLLPNNPDIFKESESSIIEKLSYQIEKIYQKNMSKLDFIVTPSCGLGSEDEKTALEVLKILSKIQTKINNSSFPIF